MRASVLRALIVVGICLLCAGACSADGRVRVTRREFGPRWPFKVSEGYVTCVTRQVRGQAQKAILFEAGGKRYAVNGWACVLRLGANIAPIWALDPRLGPLGIRKDLTPIIKRGMRLAGGKGKR